MALPKLTLLACGLVAAGYYALDVLPARAAGSYPPGVCRATDGDTVRCGQERVRLVEVDAPELPGHCRRGRVCAPGDPKASKAALAALLAGQSVRVVRYGQDRYRRTLGDVLVGGRSASCAQLRGGYAMRQLKWADYGVTARC